MQYIAPNGISVSEEDVITDVSFVWTQWKRQKIIDYLARQTEQMNPESGNLNLEKDGSNKST